MDGDRIVEPFGALAREGVRYEVVGGIALNLHGLVRATEDLDLFVDPEPANVARLGTAFDFESIEAEDADVEGIVVPLATPRMLYRMKRDTVRPQDRADAERLRREFGLEEE